MLTIKQKAFLKSYYKQKQRIEQELQELLDQIKTLASLCDHENSIPSSHNNEECMHCSICGACNIGYGFNLSIHSYIKPKQEN